MGAQVVEPKRVGIGNQQSQDAVAGGQRTDPVGQRFVNADRDEVAERAVVADDTQGAVAGMQQPAGGLHDAFQNSVQAQVLRDGYDRFEQPCHAFLGLEQFLGPGDETLKYTVNHWLWFIGGLVRTVPH
jgi:hypothetical protein